MQPLRVGRYVVHDAIASGGMATVHYGRMVGEAGFSRTVAIKRLHDSFAKDPDFIAMFIDEARLAARIRHPNVVTTLDVVNGDGVLILVMEYLHGETLSRLLRFATRDGEMVPLDIASGILCDALHGLHAAHEATSESGAPLHLVHRDVSPQNLIVGVEGITRVVDFGVAKAIGQSHVTREGQLKGKLAYMAPEQLLGEPVDRRADVYATGVVLWELLTQRSLFASETDGATMQKALSLKPPPPSSIAPHVPSALDHVVLRALARDPSQRFATARDLAQALEAAAPVASARRIGEWVDALAGDRLAARKRRLAEIEQAPAIEEATTKVEGSSATKPRLSASRAVLALAALGLVIAAPLAVKVAMSATPDPGASSSVALPLPPSTAVSSAAPSEGAIVPSAAPTVTVEPSTAPGAGTADRPSAGSVGRRGAPRKPDGNGSSRPCPVRTFVDRDGITHFARDCAK